MRRSYLHSNNGVDKEEHGNEQAHIWQRLRQRMKRGNKSYVHRTSLPEEPHTLKDWTKVHKRMRMVSPCLSSLRRRAALKSLRKLKLMKLFYSTEEAKSQPGQLRKQAAKPPPDRTPKQRARERGHEDGQTQQKQNQPQTIVAPQV